MPKKSRPASLSGEESVEVATPTPSLVPRGKESAGGGRMWGGSVGSRYEMGGALRDGAVDGFIVEVFVNVSTVAGDAGFWAPAANVSTERVGGVREKIH